MLSKVMSHHGRGNRPCPLRDTAPLESSVMEHLLGAHCVELGLDPGTNSEMVLNRIVELQLANIYSHHVLYTFALPDPVGDIDQPLTFDLCVGLAGSPSP